MSREIKFKAFDSRSSKMYDFAVLGFNGSIHVHADDWDKTHQWLDIGCGCDLYDDYDGEVSILQFTGLKDRNGVDIYEGDIMHSEDDIENPYSVYWCDQSAQWQTHCHESDGCSEFETTEALVEFAPYDIVIGNIHQHPELLEVKS